MMYNRGIFWVSITVILLYGAVAIAAPVISPFNPSAVIENPLQPPGHEHLLGTNATGQDILSQLIFGTRVTLMIGLCAAILSCTISTSIGIVSGYYGGTFDEVTMRIIDIIMTIPLFPLLLVLTLFFTPGIVTVAILMGVLGSTHGIRIIRSQVISLKKATFIEGLRAIGAQDHRIMTHHIVPNTMPLIMVKFVSSMQHYLLLGVGLSFLGLGDPTVVDWGQMIEQAYSSSTLR